MNRCEQHQMRISALIDGELEQREYLELLDHVLDCSQCALFFRSAKHLQQVVEGTEACLPSASDATAAGAAVSASDDAGRSKRRAGAGHRERLVPGPAWGWAAAFVLVAVVTLWQVWPGPSPADTARISPEGGRDADLTIVLETSPDAMTEDRFLSMAVELLQADERYQTKMAEVLHAATNTRAARLTGAL